MEGVACHFIGRQSLLLLIIASVGFVRSDPTSLYKQQVVVVLDDDLAIQRAGQLLYERYDTSSHVLKWNVTTQALEQVEWNADAGKFEATLDQQLPIGDQQVFSWSDTMLNVLGLIENTMLSGFSPESLATLIAEDLVSENIGYNINILTTSVETPAYLTQFMYSLQQLQRFQVTACLRSAIAWVDHSGRELTGQVVTVNGTVAVEWRHASPPDMWIGHLTGISYEVEIEQVSANLVGNPPMKSPYFGILPKGVEVHVTNYNSSAARPPAYGLTDNSTFEWMDQIAEKTYNDTPIGHAPTFDRQVQLLSGSQNVSELSVIEIESILDLLKELRHYGDKGPAMNVTYVYYRFGSWVLSMNEATFDVKVVGIIVSPADPVEKTTQVESILRQWRPIPNEYPSMQQGTSNSFLDDVTNWINGDHGDIELEMEAAYNAQCGVGMFLSEAIRSFHVHITNMISLDLAQDDYLMKENIFNSHPMAREGTWQILDSSSRRKTGLSMLRDSQARSGSLNDEAAQRTFDNVLLRVSLIGKTWLSHIDDAMVIGSRSLPPRSKEDIADETSYLANLLSAVENIGSTPPWSETHLRVFELQESTNRLLSLNISEPEMGTIDTLILDFTEIDHRTLPLQASIALNSDHAYISDLISEELRQKEYQTGKKYEVVPDTVDVDEDSDIVKFFVRELNNVSSELEPIKTNFDQSKLRSKALLKKLISLYNGTKPDWYKKGEAWLKKGEAVYNTIMGMVSSIKELEDGKILKGAFDLAKNAYKFGQVTGIDKLAAKFLGKALKGLANKAGESTTFSAVKKVEGKVTSLVGDFKALKTKFAPIIGTLFNVYSIAQDFNRHSTIGYIDAAFDIATTVLSLIPAAEPFAAVLSIIKVGVDYFYTDISKELHALPPNPSVGQVVVAVLKGIGEGIIDIIKDIWNNINIFGIIGNCHKLDDQYNKDQDFLRSISNYQNYYNMLRENGSNVSEINFAGGSDSWNGGDIIFHLGENGQSTLTVEITGMDGQPHNETHQISSNSVEDIVLGIGETHAFSFRKVTITALWFIHVDSKNIISGDEGEKQTLYGTYFGNSQNNKFIAVQELPPEAASNLNYNLHDYHYTLYGGGGNDSFYLGPQPTYVEGNTGSDSYFINSTSTFTEINSHSGDGQDDTMIINLNFAQIQAQKDGLNLNLVSSNTHKIVLLNWFHDVTHQRVVFKTGDGVLFKVSATITEDLVLIPYALSGSSATQAQVYNACLPLYSNVFAIAGSKYDDTLYGNDLDNQLNGAGGNDHMTGGEGQDTYHVDLDKGIDTINNFALNEEVDNLIIGTDLDELLFTSEEDSSDLFITRNVSGADESQTSATGAIIKNWFLNETYRHLLVVTNDQSIVKVSSNKTHYVSYQPFVINMSMFEEEAAYHGEVYDGVLDLNSNPDYVEVTTVIGTPFNDTIIGNGKDNYISAEQGLDFIEGKEGADTYVVRKGDGGKTILNCAKDKNVDTLLLDMTFNEVQLSNTSHGDLVLSGSPEHDIEVTLNKWFNDSQCQHLLVRSADGVTFELPNTTDSLTKTAKSVDNSNLTTNVQLVLAGKWGQVERVVGSKGDDQIRGNSLDNYIDPGVGNSYLEGGNGSDTYIIQSDYGENIINNYAEDNQPDSILFNVPFRMIEAEVVDVMHIRLSSLSEDGLVSIKLMDYNFDVLDNARHLMVTTSDGISFVLPIANSSNANNYKPIPVSINMAHATTGQHLHLEEYPDFTEVRTVYGASKYQNSIVGNEQNNTLVGGSQSDSLQGLGGDDTLKGEDGNDAISGGPGFDILVGGDGDDNLDGGEEDDVILPGTGTNQVNGGSGTDTVMYSGDLKRKEGIVLDLSEGTCSHDGESLDMLEGIENAYGTNYDDVIAGDDQDNVLMGMGGNDTLSPGSGYDILNGGNGSDIYDITYASGTVTIENLADDQSLDVVLFGYANLSGLWYEITGDDVVVRAINSLYPMFYDGDRPAVVFRSFMKGPQYQHISIETADSNITSLSAFINSTALPSPSGSSTATPSTSATTISGPSSPVSSSGLYIALGISLTILAVFVSFVLLGVYKVRRRKVKKRYIKL